MPMATAVRLVRAKDTSKATTVLRNSAASFMVRAGVSSINPSDIIDTHGNTVYRVKPERVKRTGVDLVSLFESFQSCTACGTFCGDLIRTSFLVERHVVQ